MFTEGLDETAINWIKQKSEVENHGNRSPLSVKLNDECQIPRSPVSFSSTAYMSSHVLPPLKFHSSLLGGTCNIATQSLDSDECCNDYTDGDESVDSVQDELERDQIGLEHGLLDGNCEDVFGLKSEMYSNRDEENGFNRRHGLTLNRGFSKQNLQVEVPKQARRFAENEIGYQGSGRRISISVGSCRSGENFQVRSVYGTPMGSNIPNDLGTPSAPPIFDIGEEGHASEVESELGKAFGGLGGKNQTTSAIKESNDAAQFYQNNMENTAHAIAQSPRSLARESEFRTSTEEAEAPAHSAQKDMQDHAPYYSASNQNAWQTLIAYDACVRLCLNAWARECTEAPEFLRDECLLLRSTFGLHNFLLQPRATKQIERPNKSTEPSSQLKVKKVVGKIRVEVRKLRIIPKRKLKTTHSLRGAMYAQLRAEYVRHISSLVKSGISSLGITSFSITSEEPLLCLVCLKSFTEDSQQLDPTSAISLRPGSGAYHDFFPENQGDALLLEVVDCKKVVQGRATIPISAVTDNSNDKVHWWPIHHEDNECVGKVQVAVGGTFSYDEAAHIKSGTIVETLAYDLLLEAAMRAQYFHARNLCLDGSWKWLLTEFSEYYGVSDSYTKLRYLSCVMNVATPTKDCLELVHVLLIPIMKSRIEKSLTRQEKSILLDCETQIESLLANVFENYKSLDENSHTGLVDILVPIPETSAPALAPAVQVYTLLHDILAPDAQMMLRNYLQRAAMKRCRRHMIETDDLLSSNTEDFVIDSIAISTAYLKMKTLCINLTIEIQADIKIHNQHILPSSMDLPSITAAVYSTEMCNRLRGFLSVWPPSGPQPHVNELLIATSDFERNLESWSISPVEGGVDSRNLYHSYIMVWIQDMQLNLLERCKAEKVPWSAVTSYCTSPFAEEMYEKTQEMQTEYEVVISRWPQYTLVLENAVANVERAIIKALEKQYGDILAPLKDTIPKRLGMQVQKLARRQSTTLYSIHSDLGTFLNTIKRILDVLHFKVEDQLKSWSSCLPVNDDKKSTFGEQMNGITVLLRTKYKNYLQAVVVKLVANMQTSRSTRLQRILEEIKETDGEGEIRDKMQMLSSQISDSINNLHAVFSSWIFVAICRGFWDKMGQIVLKFLEGRKENRVWYNGSYHALGILDDTFASQMQRLQGNALLEKDLESPRSISEARAILCRDTTNAADTSNYLYF